ncbi:hypothetical protein DY000_02055853 [Brassica cretica]|uniref:Uncharacterized protein n=1 Tax=Brassica cretica TaxID=69181 RepID=A0ABQ7A6Y1_BRACR|nr:hypothetical protein DY000_02055853 [Brassica cretica]
MAKSLSLDDLKSDYIPGFEIRIIQLFPQVVARVLAAVPASPREELWESSRKAMVTPLTPAQQRRLVSNHLYLPTSP